MILLNEFILLINIVIFCYGQTSTTLSTCANEKKVLKLDIRQRVSLLDQGSTIEDIDGYALCQEAYEYDYIWLHQLWTPSKYNYKNKNGQPEQANDYREFQNIKEYTIDPQLGTLTNLYKFLQNVKKNCLHMKFLGEFSFYVPRDSYLISNVTRFLRRPQYQSPNIDSDQIDDEGFQIAINDQMKHVPFAVPWNYFTKQGFGDMQDIIYRCIITQNQLDGIVFLQPSLGLYNSVIKNYYESDINDQGDPNFLKDFYENIKLQSMATNLYFMGGEDINLDSNQYNSLYKSKLLNYLQIIYGQPTPDNNWDNKNFTFQPMSYVAAIDDKLAKSVIQNTFDAPVKESMSPTKNSCIRFNYTNLGNGVAGVQNSQGFYVIVSSGYTQDAFTMLYAYDFGSPNPRGNASFFFGEKDIVEVQFEPQSYLVRYRKLYLENNQQASLYTYREPNYNNIKFVTDTVGQWSYTGIAFPFMFSSIYKHSNLAILGHRHIQLTAAPNNFKFAQIEPNINQAENNFTLNFQILYIAPSSQLGLGVCDQDRVQKNGHESQTSQEFGSYMLYNTGTIWRNSTTNQDTGQGFSQDNLVSISYIKQNRSLSYYKDKTYLLSFALQDNVKNLNFCICANGQYTTVYLEY